MVGKISGGLRVSTILLVDDDAIVRQVLGPSLTHAGFTVLTATDGKSAIAQAATHEDAIDVLVSDLQMPGLCGVDLAEYLVELRPGLKVVLISASMEPPADLPRDWLFLRKPFPSSALVEALTRLNGAVATAKP
jgi:CheY-like chemotaxis protein